MWTCLSKLFTLRFSLLATEQLDMFRYGLSTTCPANKSNRKTSRRPLFPCEVVPFGNFVPKVVYHSPCCGFWDIIVFVFSCFFPVSVCYPIILGRVTSSVFPPIPTPPCHILQELVYVSHCIKIFIYAFKLFFFLKILQSIKFTTQSNNNNNIKNAQQSSKVIQKCDGYLVINVW